MLEFYPIESDVLPIVTAMRGSSDSLSLSDSQPVHQFDVTREQAFAVNGSEGSSAEVVNAQN